MTETPKEEGVPAARPAARRIVDVLLWAVGVGIWTGAVHVAISAVRRFGFSDFIWVSRDFIWMTPVGYAAIFLAIAVPLALLALFVSHRSAVRLIAFVFGSLGALAILLLFPGLHSLAALAVALGVGVRVAAWAAGAPDGRTRWLAKTGGALALILAVAALAFDMSRQRAESREIAALSAVPVADTAAPNVIILILDTVRAASMGFLGYPRATTPNLDALARESVTFEHAYATAPWTLPSHAGIFTGKYPSSLSTDWRVPLDRREPTLAEVFRANGYVTGAFAANHFYTSWESGLERGFVHLSDYHRSAKQALLSTSLLQTNFFWSVVDELTPGNVLKALTRMDLRTQTMWTSHRKLAHETLGEFLQWERERDARPFLAFINLYDAHLPYDPPPPWGTKFATAEKPSELDRYDGAIAYMDAEVGRMLDSLRARGVLDRTILIVSSDHGEGFGEHGMSGHGNSLYRPEIHVPLLIRFPSRAAAGARVSAPVSLRDLGATALDLAALTEGSRFPGLSLARVWSSAEATASPVVSEVSAGINTEPHFPVSKGAMRSLVDSTAHWIRNGDGREELYFYRADPQELRDMAPNDPTRAAALRAAADTAVRR